MRVDNAHVLRYYLTVNQKNMSRYKNKLALTLLFLAISSFVFISVGGEYLHSIIHHHNDQDSHDQCAVSQLQVQAFTGQAAVILVLLFLLVAYLKKTYQISIFQICFNLPYSHAPPVSL